jgi:hypothetical protein
MMVAVAAIAVALFAERTHRRWKYFRERASHYAQAEALYLRAAGASERMLTEIPADREDIERPIVQSVVDKNHRGAAESARLSRYYESRW